MCLDYSKPCQTSSVFFSPLFLSADVEFFSYVVSSPAHYPSILFIVSSSKLLCFTLLLLFLHCSRYSHFPRVPTLMFFTFFRNDQFSLFVFAILSHLSYVLNKTTLPLLIVFNIHSILHKLLYYLLISHTSSHFFFSDFPFLPFFLSISRNCLAVFRERPCDA